MSDQSSDDSVSVSQSRDANDTLSTLREMSEQGTKEWWRKDVRYVSEIGHECWQFDACGVWVEIPSATALDLVAASCERWLVGKGWNLVEPGVDHQREYENDPLGTGYMTLTKAIEHAVGHTMDNQ